MQVLMAYKAVIHKKVLTFVLQIIIWHNVKINASDHHHGTYVMVVSISLVDKEFFVGIATNSVVLIMSILSKQGIHFRSRVYNLYNRI